VTRTTLLTCSVFPDLTRVWHYFARRYTARDRVAIEIYDCGASLSAEDFPDALIVRRPNLEHGRNIDHAVRRPRLSPLLFLSDDDSFIIDRRAEPIAAVMLRPTRVAAVSFRPVGWWRLPVGRHRHAVMGTNALVFKPAIVRREHLSFRRRSTRNPHIRNGIGGYYDTGDHAQEQLIRRGYATRVVPRRLREPMVVGYSGVSRGFLSFARPVARRREYRPVGSHATLAARVLAHARHPVWPLEKLRWACGVAAVLRLHRRLFTGEPRLRDFLEYGELAELAEAFPRAQRAAAVDLVNASRRTLERLETAAGLAHGLLGNPPAGGYTARGHRAGCH
jgi:hypothetical protein